MSPLHALLKRQADRPAFGPMLLLAAGLLLLGPHVPHAGLHRDDLAFHQTLAAADWPAIQGAFQSYVPGRNLYILYYAAMYKVLGPDPRNLHLFGLSLDLLNVLLAFFLIRRIGGGAALSLSCAGLFLAYPNHSETHFWTSSVAMNLLSTTFLLAAFLWACTSRLSPPARWGGAALLFALALFDYDQVFFMWIPLLFCAARLLPGPRPETKHLTLFGAACLAMNLAHAGLRILTPGSGANRPSIRLGNLLSSAASSLSETFVPMRKLPRWELLWSWVGGPLPTLLMVAAIAAAGAAAVMYLAKKEDSTTAPYPLLAFGALWFFCAYLPNYFWFISARHNYLPSFGFLLALCLAAAAVLKKWPGLRPAAVVLGFLGFLASGSASLAQGRAWSQAAALHDRFKLAAVSLLPADTDNLFLLEAPATIRGAPVFQHPEEHLYLFAQATGLPPPRGDFSITPGRTGAFYGNQVRVFGADNLQWRSYAGMNVILYGEGGQLTCASSLRLVGPRNPGYDVPLSQDPRCRPAPPRPAPVWLVDSSEVPAPTDEPLLKTSFGAALLGATLSESDGSFDIQLLVAHHGPKASAFAVAIALEDASGRKVFEPIYPADSTKAEEREAFWPSYDDLHPGPVRPGRALRSTYRFQSKGPLPQGPLRARLSFFQTSPGVWKKTEERLAPLKRL